tara:strand:+ start:16 stop:210 length:195 start_codon:yes stop_codon:yes gene_type:complete
MIVKLAVHYEQQRTDKKDNNNGLLYGIYCYDVPKEDLDTDNMFNNDIVHVEWYKTKSERNINLN